LRAKSSRAVFAAALWWISTDKPLTFFVYNFSVNECSRAVQCPYQGIAARFFMPTLDRSNRTFGSVSRHLAKHA